MRTARRTAITPAPALIAALTFCAAGTSLVATSAATRAQEETAREKRTLEQRVADLEKEVAALRAEVRQSAGNRPSSSPSFRIVPSPRPGDAPTLRFEVPGTAQPAPPGSRPFPFNGQTYYWVPLEVGTGGASSVPAPSASPVRTP